MQNAIISTNVQCLVDDEKIRSICCHRGEGSDKIPNHVDRLWNHKESCEESWNQLESARITTVFRIEII